MAVVEVADLLEAGGLEPVGFVDDEWIGLPAVLGFGVNVWVDAPVFGVVLKPATKYRGQKIR
ncbi:hypothetical protein ACVWY0_003235 [Arthrobacter sp. UYNi723]